MEPDLGLNGCHDADLYLLFSVCSIRSPERQTNPSTTATAWVRTGLRAGGASPSTP